MLKILKKQYLILIEILHFKNFNLIVIKYFPELYSKQKIKCNYLQPPWMTDNIKKSMKQRSKLTKTFYKNGQRNSDHIKVLGKSE